mmetsp:Transcript_25494/g.52805  ORF Transcript_25494/g.52805 Transcript_25494/m.52805 type:complete len:590 (-) Transcript_25494:100-1869(-)
MPSVQAYFTIVIAITLASFQEVKFANAKSLLRVRRKNISSRGGTLRSNASTLKQMTKNDIKYGMIDDFVGESIIPLRYLQLSMSTETPTENSDASLSPTDMPSDESMNLSTAIPTEQPSAVANIPILPPFTSMPTDRLTRPSETTIPTNPPINDLLTTTPTAVPTKNPSLIPTTTISNSPTNSPTISLTEAPSKSPSRQLSKSPTNPPSKIPILPPTASPTILPSESSTSLPTESPTNSPEPLPTNSPSKSPNPPSTLSPTAKTLTDSPITSAPTGNCGLTNENRTELMFDIIITVSNQNDFRDPESPQSLASKWIINNDLLRLCPQQKEELIQRYVAAVFYYSVGGDSWDECSAPLDFDDVDAIEAANDDCNIQSDFSPGDVSGSDAWLTPITECEWGGISCTSSDDTQCPSCINQISFEENGLSGKLPIELKEFSEMKRLALQRGNLQSTIPIEYSSLANLIVLDLDFNNLSGTLDGKLFESWRNMKELDLNNNALSGTISTKIGMLESLRFLQLDSNEFDGTIPTELGELNELVFAAFTDLNLNGMMPSQVCSNRGNPTDPSDGNLAVLVADCDRVFCECCSDCEL